jgi:AbrB family looped-hinge helix DNA binding protein
MLAVVGDLKAVLTSWHESAAMRITSKGQITIPQEIREQCGLLPHTRVRFVVEGGRVLIEKEPAAGSPGSEGLQRLRRARLRTRLSTDELLALSRGEEQS